MVTSLRRMLGSYAESEAMTAWDDVFADVPQWFLPVTEFIDTELQNDEELRERLLTALTAQPQVQEMQQEKTPAGEEEGEKGAAKGRQLKQWIRNMVDQFSDHFLAGLIVRVEKTFDTGAPSPLDYIKEKILLVYEKKPPLRERAVALVKLTAFLLPVIQHLEEAESKGGNSIFQWLSLGFREYALMLGGAFRLRLVQASSPTNVICATAGGGGAICVSPGSGEGTQNEGTATSVSKVQRAFWQCVFTLREAAFAPATPPPPPAISVAAVDDEEADEAEEAVEEEEEEEQQNGYGMVVLPSSEEAAAEEDDDPADPAATTTIPPAWGW